MFSCDFSTELQPLSRGTYDTNCRYYSGQWESPRPADPRPTIRIPPHIGRSPQRPHTLRLEFVFLAGSACFIVSCFIPCFIPDSGSCQIPCFSIVPTFHSSIFLSYFLSYCTVSNQCLNSFHMWFCCLVLAHLLCVSSCYSHVKRLRIHTSQLHAPASIVKF